MCRHGQITHHLKHGHILNQDSIRSRFRQICQQLAGRLQFVIIDNSVDRHIDLRTEGMGIVAEFPDVINTISHSRPCTKAQCTDIDGIGAMVDGCHTIFQILGGGK